jgi:hypothetical protein
MGMTRHHLHEGKLGVKLRSEEKTIDHAPDIHFPMVDSPNFELHIVVQPHLNHFMLLYSSIDGSRRYVLDGWYAIEGSGHCAIDGQIDGDGRINGRVDGRIDGRIQVIELF